MSDAGIGLSENSRQPADIVWEANNYASQARAAITSLAQCDDNPRHRAALLRTIIEHADKCLEEVTEDIEEYVTQVTLAIIDDLYD